MSLGAASVHAIDRPAAMSELFDVLSAPERSVRACGRSNFVVPLSSS